jgi:outer membrane protein, heavy metal efflux system
MAFYQEIRMSPDPAGRRRRVIVAIGLRGHLRMLGAAMLVFAQSPGAVYAQAAALTEREAVEMALARPAYLAAQEGRVAIAESAALQAGLPPNPSVGISHERGNVSAGRATESTLQLSQSFDISGRRTLRRQAAEQRIEAAQFDRESARKRLAADVRAAFADALYRDRVRSGLRAWNQRIDAAYDVVSKLAKAGEASGYDRRRLERERQSVQARFARAEADYGRAREVLVALTGDARGRTVTPAGDLLPPGTPGLGEAQANLRGRPELQSLIAQAVAFDSERLAAQRAWLPDLTISGGPKRIDEPTRSDNAVVVSASIAIPLFDRGQAAQKRASAEASVVRAEHSLRLERWEAELRGTWLQADELRRAALAFRRDSAGSSRELAQIAEAAYRGGEATLLELLDAYRNELEAETTSLELELAARLARIELDLLSGAAYE